MHIEHFEKGIRYTDRELLLLARKIGKLATYCEKLKNDDSLIRVEAMSRNTKKKEDHVKVLISIYLPQKTLHAESRHPTAIEAMDRCIEKLEPQIKRYKEQHIPQKQRRTRKKSREVLSIMEP
ncbi:HPF/RaiA family ribosome-associated protein [Candidatus Peregrinibacteria bacterium]|nr:HPF/RaiA family ribosome-associated protein [Candidatus Peregrinibacteria bacterium]MBI2523822.1 HPF/RaiA family ribosome-associated protein [Candidatus Peregrinibacteria bacterium]